MEISVPQMQSMPLVRPGKGQSARWRLGRIELVLEPVRGGWSLLWLDGQRARTWSLGLRDEGELWLQCRVPRFGLQVSMRDTLVLVPGSRVRGYVAISLVPTIVWRDRDGSEQTVAELLPPMLSAEWDDAREECVQQWTSPLFQRLPPPAEEPQVVLPLTVRNASPRMQSPESLPLRLEDRELRACRGHLMAAPRRLVLREDGRIEVQRRAVGHVLPAGAPSIGARQGGQS